MRQYPAKSLALAVCGCTALWSVQAAAASSNQPTLEQLQQQIQQLQQQVQDMKTQQQQQQQQQQAANTVSAEASNPETGKGQSNKKLTLNGGAVAEYQVTDHDNPGRRTGGDLILDYFDLGFTGDAGNGITYGADYRWGTNNIADDQYLHNAWAAYTFGAGDSSQIKGGLFQVPFGNMPFGYQSFWAPARYYLGFNDNQAAGLAYKYEADGFRLDVAAFKNDDLEQSSTYGSNPTDGYDQINGGAVRLGYTFNQSGDNNLDVSASVRGGQLEVDDLGYANDPDNTYGDDNGTRWVAAIAATANIGKWTLQGQINDYRYNIPDNTNLPRNAVTFENYGFTYAVPASGQLYSFSFARSIPVSLGPISSFSVYDDIDYLDIGGRYADPTSGGADGFTNDDTTFNVAGVSMTAGPIMVWAEMVSAKNGALGFDGPNDGDWHHRFNLTAAYYFSGDLIQ